MTKQKRAKVLMVGPVSGRLRLLSDKIRTLQKSKAGPFDVCLCAGPFFYQAFSAVGEETTAASGTINDELNEATRDGQDLVDGSLTFDIPVLFVDVGDGPPKGIKVTNSMVHVLKKDEDEIALDEDDDDIKNDEDEIEIDLGEDELMDGGGDDKKAEAETVEGHTSKAPRGLRRIAHNLYQLVGDSGSVADIVSVPLPLIDPKSKENAPTEDEGENETTLTIGFIGPKARLPIRGFEEKTTQASFLGCDVLLSGEWGRGMSSETRGALTADDRNALMLSGGKDLLELGSYDVAQLVLMSRPRYHVAPGPINAKLQRRFVASLPYRYPAMSSTDGNYSHVGRFLAMGSVLPPSEFKALGKAFKFIHAVGFVPLSCMDTNDGESTKELGSVVDCPYTSASKRVRDSEDGPDVGSHESKRQRTALTTYASREVHRGDSSISNENIQSIIQAVVHQANSNDPNQFATNTQSSTSASVSHLIAGLGTQLQNFGSKIEALETKVNGRAEDKAMIELYRENSQLQSTQLKLLQEENRRLKHQVKMSNSAVSGAIQDQLADSTTAPDFQDPMALLENPIESTDVKVDRTKKLGGITVKIELTRLWENGIFKEKKEEEPDEDIPKRIIFDRDHALFVGLHPTFALTSEGKAYQNSMTLVAMAMTTEQWNAIMGGELDNNAAIKIFKQVEIQTLNNTYQLELETMVRKADAKRPRQKATLHSLGGRFKRICEGLRKMGKSNSDIDDWINEKTAGC